MTVYSLRATELKNTPIDYARRHFPSRLAKALAYKNERDMLLCIGVGYLLAKIVGIAENSICRGKYGKPYVPGSKSRFNIAHSEEFVIVGVDEDELGVDIERLSEIPEFNYNLFFVREEIDWFGDNPRRFFSAWTAKEAAIKAVGNETLLDPTSFSVLGSVIDGEPLRVAGRFLFFNQLYIEDYCIALFTLQKRKSISYVEIQLSELHDQQ